MSNSNNNNTRNVSNAYGPDDNTINMEGDIGPSTSQQHQQRLHWNSRRVSNTTRINIDANGGADAGGSSGADVSNNVDGNHPNVDDRHRLQNLISMLRETGHQLRRQQSFREHNSGDLPTGWSPRTWHESLSHVIVSQMVAPRAQVLRSIFRGNIRYNSLPTNDDTSHEENFRFNSLPTNDNPSHEENFHFLLNSNSIDQDIQTQHHRSHPADIVGDAQSTSNSGLGLSRQSSRLDDRSVGENTSTAPITPPAPGADPLDAGGSRRQSSNGGRLSQRQSSVAGSTAAPTIEMDDPDTNDMDEMVAKLLSHFVRYLPFICILLVKFIHDHLLGILGLIVLHAVMYHVNKSLKEQVAKINQKSFTILVRDTVMIICIVSYRFILATSMPDPFGLLINPPGQQTLDFNPPAHEKIEGEDGTFDPVRSNLNNLVSKNEVGEVPADPTSNPMNSGTISLTNTISLGVLLYYVVVNDLILKLLTQLVKIQVTMLPTKVIDQKSRARLYALVEYISQFYRALAPMRQWLKFLFEPYTGLEIISGILFSSFYLGVKGIELVERGKCLKKALVSFIRNKDYDRKPTKDELDEAGTVCPICHDMYTTPVVLECGHIFCDECVNTWFKREQTCPMCRAKVSEDPTWQDGATTYFYQMF